MREKVGLKRSWILPFRRPEMHGLYVRPELPARFGLCIEQIGDNMLGCAKALEALLLACIDSRWPGDRTPPW